MGDIIKSYEEAINKLRDAADIIKEVLEDLNSLDTPSETM